ncbi:hypothetical protein [Aquibacillus albus]|uniref:J domain-containing protein n=1 Tax=Aquibacillus albus TaxID=1168171 RepID=A0ABS2MYA5_9BACI|nr:hypothetical protein [Aquibacillus albus]MBM7570788.1 hypothetical protein [Aquibacillus albus]
MDIKKAYEILGVSEKVTMEELEDRFMILVKRHKNASQLSNEEETSELDQINEAYYIIRAHLLGQDESAANETFKEKLGHFIYYYKFHVVGGIIGLILIISFISSIVEGQNNKIDLPPADLTIVMLGEYQIDDTLPIQEKLNPLFPQWETLHIELFYQPSEMNSEHDMGIIVKNQAELSQLDLDLLILDEHQYSVFVERNSFVSLDHLSDGLIESVGQDKLYYDQAEEDTQEHLYGIDLADSTIFDNVDDRENKIAVIPKGQESIEKAETFITTVLESTIEE